MNFSYNLVLLFILLLPEASWAGAAASCSQAEVQNAINSASVGSIVTVPSGNCSWSTPVILSKAITLQGAGIDATTITGASNQEGTALSVTANATLNTTIKGFTFNNSGSQSYMGTIKTNGAYSNTGTIRITGNKFNTGSLNGFGRVTISAYNNQALLIDHNTFNIAGSAPTETMHLMGDGAASWTRANNLGSGTGQTIMEDNMFDATSNTSSGWALIFTSFDGARYTVRHNTFKKCYMDAHPNTWSHSYGVRQGEVYGNTFTGGPARVLDWKAGTLVFYNNTVDKLTFATLHAPTLYVPTPSGECCSISNLSSAACTQRPGFGANYRLDPIYFWNNTNISVGLIGGYSGSCGNPNTADAIRQNIEYYVNSGQKPNYTPFTYPHPLVSGATPTITLQPPTLLNP